MGILKKSTEESDNPDLRDRGYIYWRMLSTDPQSTKYVVLADKPEFNQDETDGYDENFLENLIENIGNLSSVYHVTPDDIESPTKDKTAEGEEVKKKEVKKEVKDDSDEDEEEKQEEEAPKPTKKVEDEKTKQKVIQEQPLDLGIDDLLGLNDPAPVATTGAGWAGDFMGGLMS
jgi:vesicle coat complex subunit